MSAGGAEFLDVADEEGGEVGRLVEVLLEQRAACLEQRPESGSDGQTAKNGAPRQSGGVSSG